jgi:SAM-dependent methyltransferase
MTRASGLLDEFYSALLHQKHIRNKNRARFYHKFLFQGVDFNNARVLDIGGGNGTLSFYAALMGARQVICLEPEAQGSTSGARSVFENMRMTLGLSDQLILEPIPLQSYESPNDAFDVIVLHNSVNHLDEDACIHLLERDSAKNTYRELLAKISSLSRIGATLILSDCSRQNFFARIGIRNPFAPSIEWHKHQTPEVWGSLLQEAGFHNIRVRWTPVNRLYSPGRVLTGNRLVSYFTISHFCLTANRSRAVLPGKNTTRAASQH